jgi:hypothetical protein
VLKSCFEILTTFFSTEFPWFLLPEMLGKRERSIPMRFRKDFISPDEISLESDEESSEEDMPSVDGEDKQNEIREEISAEESSSDSSETENLLSQKKKFLTETVKSGSRMYVWEETHDFPCLPKHPYKSNTYMICNLEIVEGSSMLEIFLKFLPESFWESVVKNSCGTENLIFSLPDLYLFLAFCIYRGFNSKTPIDDFWNENLRDHIPGVASIIDRSTFWKVSRNIHVSNRDQEDPDDRVAKVRPMYEILNQNSILACSPGRSVSLDEASPGYSGRSINVTATPNKKVSSALQSFSLNDPATGYCFQFEYRFDKLANKSNDNELTKTQNQVLRLCHHLKKEHRVIVMDNFFNSPRMCDLLSEINLLCLGTWKSQYGIPHMLKQAKVTSKSQKLKILREKAPLFSLCRSYLENWKRVSCSPIAGLSFYDNNVVSMITTVDFSFENKISGGIRHKKKWQIQHDYNSTMNGVDIMDQMTSNFSTYIKSNKWWKRIFYWMLDVAIVNAYICFKTKSECSHREFRRGLSELLIKRSTELNSKGRSRKIQKTQSETVNFRTWKISPNNQRMNFRLTGDHVVQYMEFPGRCSYCHILKIQKRTFHRCQTCLKFLCEGDCYKNFHTKVDLYQ